MKSVDEDVMSFISQQGAKERLMKSLPEARSKARGLAIDNIVRLVRFEVARQIIIAQIRTAETGRHVPPKREIERVLAKSRSKARTKDSNKARTEARRLAREAMLAAIQKAVVEEVTIPQIAVPVNEQAMSEASKVTLSTRTYADALKEMLKEMRSKLGVSQAYVSKKARVSKTTLYRLEAGRLPAPPFAAITKLSKFYGVPLPRS